MSVKLHFNGQTTDATKGVSLFTHAEDLGISVPTSCKKNGKCKECVVEVIEGMECLSQPGPEERHLKGSFRLSCCSKITTD
ncbi:MAG TPA: 2Fe-2S iron-sulfur cluster binding domain-containing protein, partial [Opitutus sp.]|nr:2Fe-2S iron-sulfur cluster binding domain-containing protein [Opitutus sp.]